MATVAILGAGDIGGACAQALAASALVDRLVLIDDAERVAKGKALDLQQSCAIGGFQTRLHGTNDLSAAIGCAVCIVADRFGTPGEWRGEDGLAMVKRLTSALVQAPLVFAGVAQNGLISTSRLEAGVARHRLIGCAPQALRGAIAAIVALEARCSPADVSLGALGVPPEVVVPWSDASIAGYPLQRSISQAELARIEARAAKLWPPGAYALGAAAAQLTEAILGSSRRTSHVLTILNGEFGVRDRLGAVPAILGSHGIDQIRVPPLNTRERVQLDTVLGVP